MSDLERVYEAQLDALYQVGQVLSRSLDLQETLQALLDVLDGHADLRNGVVALFDPDTERLWVSVVQGGDERAADDVSYERGEGIMGTVLASGEPMVVPRAADEPRFLGRLGVFEPELAFVGVPLQLDGATIGVLAAQPGGAAEELPVQTRFMTMTAGMITQSVRLSLRVAKERRELKAEADQLRRTVRAQYGFDNVIGSTERMKRVFELVRQVAKWNTTVLIRGESGTGKELIANAIHYNSPRSSGPFIRVNCAALPETLLESELFGHEKGAFTGATTMRKGRFEQADQGTLFLDEIGDISPTFQAKLLRVLQEGEFERVGGSRSLKVNVRVIAATNRDLESAVAADEFREDLYYRLNVMPIQLPALRERLEDVPRLAEFLVNKLSRAQGRELTVTDGAIRMLMRHDWPGNVRELENCLERCAIMSEEGVIDQDIVAVIGLDGGGPLALSSDVSNRDLDDPELDDRERVVAALEQAGWVQAKAARLLNMTPRQIAYRIQTMNIKLKQI